MCFLVSFWYDIFWFLFYFFMGDIFWRLIKESCFLVANCIIVSKSYNFFVVSLLFLFSFFSFDINDMIKKKIIKHFIYIIPCFTAKRVISGNSFLFIIRLENIGLPAYPKRPQMRNIILNFPGWPNCSFQLG